MINITYDIWKESCELIQDYSLRYGKYYLQLYPFYKYNNLKYISSFDFYKKYVSSNAIFANYDNFDRIDNYCRKSDGSYRKRYLIPPIMYIYYISIGLYFSKKYNQKRNDDIYIEYGADYISHHDVLHVLTEKAERQYGYQTHHEWDDTDG